MPPSVPVTHSPPPPPSSPYIIPSSFPRVRSLYVLSPFLIFPTHFFSLPLYSFHYYLYWEHTIFVFLWLTYFTQHNNFLFHSRWRKWWVFVVSNGWESPPFLCLNLGVSHDMNVIVLISGWVPKSAFVVHNLPCFYGFHLGQHLSYSIFNVVWLDFNSYISTVRDSLVFFCALFPPQMLSL